MLPGGKTDWRKTQLPAADRVDLRLVTLEMAELALLVTLLAQTANQVARWAAVVALGLSFPSVAAQLWVYMPNKLPDCVYQLRWLRPHSSRLRTLAWAYRAFYLSLAVLSLALIAFAVAALGRR